MMGSMAFKLKEGNGDNLHAESLGLQQLKRKAIDLEDTLALLAKGHSGGILLASKHLDLLENNCGRSGLS